METGEKSAEMKDVLVVDDSPTMRKMLMSVLVAYPDFRFIEAENGVDALAKVAAHNIRLIFLDFNMPQMNGIDFMKQLRQDPAHRKTPIVMITTETEQDKVKQGYVTGATVYMTKPYKPTDLVKIVEAIRYWHIK
jgi:two-component system chemotaxis response regulator CheY